MNRQTAGPAARGASRRGVASRWTKARTRAFLDALAATSNVSEAARAAGVTPSAAYGRKRRDANFAAEWTSALDVGFAELEMLVLRHALKGSPRVETVREGARGKVRQVKTVHTYPLATAMRLLLAHRDEVARYRLAGASAEEAEAMDARVDAEIAAVRARFGMADSGHADSGTGDGDIAGDGDA